jgi:hypothetical protein
VDDQKFHYLQFFAFLLLLSLKKFTQNKQDDKGKKRMKKKEEG